MPSSHGDFPMKVLLTGASGFIGTALGARLVAHGFDVIGVGRRMPNTPVPGVYYRTVGELGTSTDWCEALLGVQAIIHCAARVHAMCDQAQEPLAEFRRTNVEGTLNLARQAASAGVRRFIFLSSVKVNGERGHFTEADFPAPQDAYSISKYEAELGLLEIAAKIGIEVVIIRPPLVYGPRVRANFLLLLRAVARGIPMPFGAIHNRRSLVALDNLLDFITTCLSHPAAANQTFLVSDGEDLSTTELIRRMAHALGCSARLIPVPIPLLRATATLLGKQEAAARLCQSLRVNITKAQKMLGWTPPVSVDEGLRRTAEDYLLSQE